MQIDSFTDEQLLSLINSTIEDANHNIDMFTGGSIQITSTYKNKVTTYKVMLFFGYDKNKNPVTYTEEIEEEYYSIWGQALITKIHSLKAYKNGSGFNSINERMNRDNINKNDSRNEDSTTSTLPLPITSTNLPTTSLPKRTRKKFEYTDEFEEIWSYGKRGDKSKAYSAYLKIKDTHSTETLIKVLKVENLKAFGKRHTATVFNGDIDDLLSQELNIIQDSNPKEKQYEVGTLAWERQQAQKHGDTINAELI